MRATARSRPAGSMPTSRADASTQPTSDTLRVYVRAGPHRRVLGSGRKRLGAPGALDRTRATRRPGRSHGRRKRSGRRRPDVPRRRPDDLPVGRLLEDVRGPADDPRRRERRREHVARNPAQLHDDAGVELDVRVQLPARLELGEKLEHPRFDRQSRRPPARRRTRARSSRSIRDRGSSVRYTAMPEAHDPAAGQHRVGHPLVDAVGRADRIERVERTAGRAAVQRSGQRAERADDGRRRGRPRWRRSPAR